MKKTGFLLSGLLLTFVSGCSKQPGTTVSNDVVIAPSSSPTSVRGYVVPSFQGWKSESYLKSGADEVNSVLLRKSIGEQKLNVKFTLFPPSLDSKPTDIEELRKTTASSLAMGKYLARSFQLLGQKETMFRGFPAIETKFRSGEKDGSFTESRSLEVVGGKSNFSIASNVHGKSITDDARQEADKAFDKLSNELKIP